MGRHPAGSPRFLLASLVCPCMSKFEERGQVLLTLIHVLYPQQSGTFCVLLVRYQSIPSSLLSSLLQAGATIKRNKRRNNETPGDLQIAQP